MWRPTASVSAQINKDKDKNMSVSIQVKKVEFVFFYSLVYLEALIG